MTHDVQDLIVCVRVFIGNEPVCCNL